MSLIFIYCKLCDTFKVLNLLIAYISSKWQVKTFYIFCLIFIVTPLDVVKIRLQTQQKAMLSNKCFLYCNGLMDHLCPCTNGKMPEWMKTNGKFNGTVVCNNQMIVIHFNVKFLLF